MAWLDIGIVGILLVSTLISLVRGFVREAFSLAVWLVALWIAWNFFRELSDHLIPWIETPSLRLGAAFSILLMAALVIGGLVNFLVVQLVERTGISGTDRLIGMIFGFTRGVLLVAALVLLAGLTRFPGDPWWHESQLVSYFEELALWLRDLLPADIAERFHYAALGRRFG